VEIRFDFATNDSDHPLITFVLAAKVNAVPDFVQRMDNPDLANGERAGDLRVWPAAYPRIYLERGEILSFWLRTWLADPGSAPISVTTEHPGVIIPVGRPAPVTNAAAAPHGAVATTIRSESSGKGYWLDIKAGPIDKAGVYTTKLELPESARELAEAAQGMLGVTLVVVDSNIVINPAVADLGTISMSSMGTGQTQIGRVNVRKVFGSFRIISVTSSLPWLSFDVTTLVNDKNYLLRIRADNGNLPRPSAVDGSILIATDDPRHLTIEVPLKLVFVP
jgi:hypothetical protein